MKWCTASILVPLLATTATAQTEKPDTFRTGQTDKPSEVQAIVRAAQGGLVIADMMCIIDGFLGRDTTAITCGLEGNQQMYQGTLVAWFTDKTYAQKQVRIEQPMTDGVMATWGITAMLTYGYKQIDHVEFRSEGANIIWDQTQAAKDVLKGTYAYKADQYPPPVRIDEMLCKTSEFLINPKGQYQDRPTYVVTCGFAGSYPRYSGKVAIWWHTYAQRVAEKDTPPPVPANLSMPENAQRVQHVSVAHDTYGDDVSWAYWGVAAFGIQSAERKVFDRMNFYLDSEESTWTIATVPQSYSRGSWFSRLFHKHRKVWLR